MVEKVVHQRTVDQRVKKEEKDAANPKTSGMDKKHSSKPVPWL